jgi:hypothetical protein
MCAGFFFNGIGENMSDGGKGSKPRPFSVSQHEYDTRWDAIFSRDQENLQKSMQTENERLGLYKKDQKIADGTESQ